jgi:methyl-accepting chemotaxis protein
MSAPRRRRWFDVLRRAAEPQGGSEAPLSGPTPHHAALWSTHADIERAVSEALEQAGRVVEAASKHRATLDGASERASAMVTHAEGLTLAATRVGDALERLSVVALNAGLEGARTAEPQGKALLILSEEIRSHVSRGAEGARDLVSVVEEIAAETGQLRKELEGAASAAEETGRGAEALGGALAQSRHALADAERHLKRVTGIDPEIARAMSLAMEHARGLISALSTLSTAAQATPLLQSALRPVIAPLSRLLRELLGEGQGLDDQAAGSVPPTGDGGGAAP